MKKYLLAFGLFICMTSIVFAEYNFNEIDKTIDLINNTTVNLQDTFLAKCPFGHVTVKRVPIIVGHYLTSDEQKKVDDLELWESGIEGKEDYKIVCTKCRYAYNPYGGYWFRDEMNPNNFEIKPDKSINSFLQLFEKQFEIHVIDFTQAIQSKNYCMDRVTFSIKTKKQNILKILKEYFKQNSISPEENRINEINSIYYEYKDGNKIYNISVEKSVNKYEIITYKVTNKNI